MKGNSKKLTLSEELENAFRLIRENGYGSIEIFVQGGVVTQITVRNIRKTKVDIRNGKLRESLNKAM